MGFGERKLIDVRHLNLKCADCGVDITELPFEPSTGRPIYCDDCNRKRRPPRSGGGGGGRGGRQGGGRGRDSRGGKRDDWRS